MSCRILIENPAPFKQMLRGQGGQLVDIPMDEGVEVARFYIEAGVRFAGFHHSDIDWYEARQMRGVAPPQRYDSLEYADYVKEKLDSFNGIFIPHRVVVYQPPEVHAKAFRRLTEHGINDIVLVGKPFSTPPAEVTYQTTVEEVLSYLFKEIPGLNLGVVVIPDREGEVQRLVTKFEAAGKRKLHLIGQFLDSADPMLSFMDALASEFARRGLNLERLEWNIGLAMFTLKNCTFHAKLLRKDRLVCEDRFSGLETVAARVEESIRMNLEFAERIKVKAHTLGLDVGFSIQPIIERNRNGSIHASLQGAVSLIRQLQRLYA
jgi:hypothetical protein